MAAQPSEVKATLEDGIEALSTNVAEGSPPVDTTNSPCDGDSCLDERCSHLAPVVAHDPIIISSSDNHNESRHIDRRAFVLRELSPLIEATLPRKDEDEMIRRLSVEDAQIIVDAIDEKLSIPNLSPFAQRRSLRLLYRACGHHAIIPNALKVVVDCDRTSVAPYRGGYADVRKGQCSGRDVAVKLIRLYSNEVLQKVIHKFCKEAVMWKSLRHPNVLPLMGVVMTENEFAMVSEWMVNGNINEFIKANPKAERLELLVGATEGLIYLHENGMVHGDLKGLNILVDQTCHARLADFGLLTIMSDPANLISSTSHGKGGTARWMSPELIIPEKFGYKTSCLTKSSDCYALGMVIYETVGGNIPFHEHTDVAASIQVILGQHPTRGEMFPDHLWGMMELCWTPQPDNRPSITDVLECLKAALGSSKSPLRHDSKAEIDYDNQRPSDSSPAIQIGSSDATTVTDTLTPGLSYITDRGPATVSYPSRPFTTEGIGEPDADTIEGTEPSLSVPPVDMNEGDTNEERPVIHYSPRSLAGTAPPRIDKHYLPPQPLSPGTSRFPFMEDNYMVPVRRIPELSSDAALERERALEYSEAKLEHAGQQWRAQQQEVEEREKQWTREREHERERQRRLHAESRGIESERWTVVPSDIPHSDYRKERSAIHGSPRSSPSRSDQDYSEYSSRNTPSEGRSSRRAVGTPVPNTWGVSRISSGGNAKPKVSSTSPSLTFRGNRGTGDLPTAATEHQTPLAERGPPPTRIQSPTNQTELNNQIRPTSYNHSCETGFNNVIPLKIVPPTPNSDNRTAETGHQRGFGNAVLREPPSPATPSSPRYSLSSEPSPENIANPVDGGSAESTLKGQQRYPWMGEFAANSSVMPTRKERPCIKPLPQRPTQAPIHQAPPYVAPAHSPLLPYPLHPSDVSPITTSTTASVSASHTQLPVPHPPALASFSAPCPPRSIPFDDDSDSGSSEGAGIWDISDNTYSMVGVWPTTPQSDRRKSLPPEHRPINRRPPKSQTKPLSFFGTSVFNEDFRPPAEEMYERLGDFFPGYDLDEPVIEDSSGGTSPTPAEAVRSFTAPNGRKQRKSIRVIANEHKRELDRTSRVSSTNDANMLRKRSTKLWGSKVEEVTNDQIRGLSSVLSTPAEPPSELKPIFKWVRGGLIYRGAYSKIYVGLNATTGEMFAVKQVEIQRTGDDRNDHRQVTVAEALKLESATLKDLDHPNVVEYLGLEETPGCLSIFLEYVPGGSIGSILRKRGRFNEDVTKSFTSQILNGLDYLHSKGIIHRDLKSDGILVEESGHCKITDFRGSRRTDDINTNEAYIPAQESFFWMAPEVVKKNKECNSKVDIWSLGCIVQEMWTGERPWPGQEAIAVILQLYQSTGPPLPGDVVLSPQADDLRKRCFAIDPDERPTAEELRRHPYLLLPPSWAFTGCS